MCKSIKLRFENHFLCSFQHLFLSIDDLHQIAFSQCTIKTTGGLIWSISLLKPRKSSRKRLEKAYLSLKWLRNELGSWRKLQFEGVLPFNDTLFPQNCCNRLSIFLSSRFTNRHMKRFNGQHRLLRFFNRSFKLFFPNEA